VFDVDETVTLTSVNVFSASTGTINIKIQDSSGTEIFETGTVAVTNTGINNANAIPLNFEISEGTGYRMLVKQYSGINLYRHTISSPNNFPFESEDGRVTITASEYGGATTVTYYFFYDLKYSGDCKSPREEVVVTISESDPILLSAESVEICEEESSELITITEGLENYDTYVWMPSVGVSGDEITGWTFSPETTTIYTLTASQSEGACTQVVTLEVLVNPLPEAQDLEDNYVVCPQAIQMISTGLSTSGTNGYDIVWSPFENLYLDAAATTAYNGEIASTVYFVSEAFGETIYQATVTSHKGC